MNHFFQEIFAEYLSSYREDGGGDVTCPTNLNLQLKKATVPDLTVFFCKYFLMSIVTLFKDS